MDNSREKFGNVEIVMVILAIILGERYVSLPRVAVDIAGYGSIVSVFLGGILSLGITYLIARLSANFPDKTIIEYSKDIMGTAVSKVLVLFYFLYFSAYGLLFVRRISEFLKQQLLFNTPLEVIIITLLFVSAYCAAEGLRIYAKSSTVFITLSLLAVGAISVLSIAYLKPLELYPAFQIESLKKINIWALGIPTYIGFEIVAFIVPFIKKHQNIKKAANIALIISTIVFTLDVIVTIGVIGYKPTSYQYYPVFTTAKSLDLPGAFNIRVDFIFTALWVLFVYVVLVGYHYLSSISLSSLAGAKNHSIFVILLIPIFFVISLVPQNLAEMDLWLRFLEKVWLYGIVGSIFLVYIIGILRKKVKI